MKKHFLIPARRDSKGVPYKNRSLVPVIFNKFPEKYKDSILLTSNDEEIIKLATTMGIKTRLRPDELASDTASMKSVIKDTIKFFDIKDDDIIVVLYPTYPDRDLADIESALSFFGEHELSSMLCKKIAKTHPYMCLRVSSGICGEPLLEHDLYRRQDYPECFEISHFICILEAGEINKLNHQLYNTETGFFSVADKLDVDYKEDFEQFQNKDYGVKLGQ